MKVTEGMSLPTGRSADLPTFNRKTYYDFLMTL